MVLCTIREQEYILRSGDERKIFHLDSETESEFRSFLIQSAALISKIAPWEL